MQKIALLTLTLVFMGCGGDDSTTPDASKDMAAPVQIPTNFDSIYTEVLGPSCGAFSVCHTPANASRAGNLALNNQSGNDPYLALVGQDSDNARAKREGLPRVKPCDADNSFLVKKLELARDFDSKTDYGYRMPADNPPLNPAVIKAIRDWINRGALRDEAATVSGSTCPGDDGGAP
jgi:hypothetical protein